ncbi:transporter [Fulvivirgaceae bacterium BMA10]|uniref:Transporter n=1 Tax=Splendidivirga corallicola TaxID=3051826 RepID=A0ABT8KQD2_9BACT|nr:transporter [Fulvivirgaceae bacterium BMA10]
MSDEEFDILDELYFVLSFEVLVKELDLQEDVIKVLLLSLIKKGWVKCFEAVDREIVVDDTDFEDNYFRYYYLATKEGLLAHNSN